MRPVVKYLVTRGFVYLLEIFAGITICFIIPRLTPLDPVSSLLNRISMAGEYSPDPKSLESLKNALIELYGLKGSYLDQYIAFLKRLFAGDLGPSYSAVPTPVTEIIQNALPWTLGLLTLTTIISWLLGNLIGGVVGYYSEKRWAKALSSFAVAIYPIPYYIMAIILVMLFAYVFPIFPLGGGLPIGFHLSLSIRTIFNLLQYAFLPAFSLVIVGYGWWFISMRALAVNTKTEDYVAFGDAAGLPRNALLSKYVIRNSLLPQVTGLAVSLGSIFSGAMATEIVFDYPGIGRILYISVTSGDFNLTLGILLYSIIATATAALIVDFVYPLIDPRIRYK